MLTDTGLRLERYMDRLSLRQSLTASNIANADTPGYKTKDVDFQSELELVRRMRAERAKERAA